MGGNLSQKSPDVFTQRRLFLAAALIFAMLLPTVVAYFYFLALAPEKDAQNPVQKAVFGLGKVVQFLLPLVVVFLIERRIPRPDRPRFEGIALGVGFGLLAGAALFGLYYGWLADSPVLGSAPQRVREKINQFGLSTPALYFLFAAVYVAAHSLFEEYYFRWFIFGYLRKLLPFTPAAVISGLAFMAHHVIVLYVYLPNYFLVAAVPFSFCIAVGGFFWAWLYERTGTLYSAWASHAIVDAAIFLLGWILMQRLDG
jgi:membrane protease YdiL (CAAX protease family)